jgi:hypothetical protein
MIFNAFLLRLETSLENLENKESEPIKTPSCFIYSLLLKYLCLIN